MKRTYEDTIRRLMSKAVEDTTGLESKLMKIELEREQLAEEIKAYEEVLINYTKRVEKK